MTLEQLSERGKITPNYLGRIENERVDPSLSVVIALAKALGVAVGELVDSAASVSPRRVARNALSESAQSVGLAFDELPLDVRETLAPLIYAVVKRLGRSRDKRARRRARS